jgi:hypothetical protein
VPVGIDLSRAIDHGIRDDGNESVVAIDWSIAAFHGSSVTIDVCKPAARSTSVIINV